MFYKQIFLELAHEYPTPHARRSEHQQKYWPDKLIKYKNINVFFFFKVEREGKTEHKMPPQSQIQQYTQVNNNNKCNVNKGCGAHFRDQLKNKFMVVYMGGGSFSDQMKNIKLWIREGNIKAVVGKNATWKKS